MPISHISTIKTPQALTTAPFHVFYSSQEQLKTFDKSKIITTINFASTPSSSDDSFTLALPLLNKNNLSEVWLARDKLVSGKDGDVEYRKNNEIVFGKVELRETDFDSLESCSEHAYDAILNFIKQKEFPHLIRIWNYFPNINQITDNRERYQSFCVGRYRAFTKLTEFERSLPAATAVGSHGGGLVVYFIATTKAGVQVENPRQISAYHYPKQYSPKSPSFARATLKHWPTVSQFFISGTASIVGHETLHEENVLVQLEEILKNIDALVDTARDTHQQPIRDISDLSLMKVYIRNPDHYAMIEEALSQRVGKDVDIIYLQGDICRDNLLLEIEAVAELKH